MNKILTVSVFAISLMGCGATSYYSSPTKVTNSSFSYEPQGKEEFVFSQKATKLQQYGYMDVCFIMPTKSVDSECLHHNLDYDDYVGKRGYYTDKPPFVDSSRNVVREAILETGEIIYPVSSEIYDHIGEDFVPKDLFDKVNNFKAEPIVEGSSVMITGYSNFDRNRVNVSSQNRHNFTEEEIKVIRDIANSYPNNNVSIANLLTTLKVKHDDFSNSTRVSGLPYNNEKSYLTLEIDFKYGKTYGFMKAFYKSNDWLFVDNFSTKADGKQWNSSSLEFKRDNSGGNTWEWVRIPIDADMLNMLDDMASADKSVVRFYGNDYYDDHTFSLEQKKELSSLIELFRLTK